MTAARIRSFAVVLGGTIVLYLILNFLIVGGQKLWHSKDQKRLDAVMAILNRESPIIDVAQAGLGTSLEALSRSSAEIEQDKASLKSIDERYPNGMPNAVLEAYNYNVADLQRRVTLYNEQVAVYESSRAALQARIAEYNDLVAEANTLVDKIGPTWYLVPLPRSSARTRP